MQQVGTDILCCSNVLGIKEGENNKQIKVVYCFKREKFLELKCNANSLHLREN
mgnify:CR=1 FL=1